MVKVTLINPQHSKRTSLKRSKSSKRGANPALILMGLGNPRTERSSMAKRRRHHIVRHHHYRSNPFGVDTKKVLVVGGWAIVGGVATRAIPENFLSGYNSGVIGYLMNAAIAFGGGYGIHAVGGPAWSDSAFGFVVGGVVALAGRIVSDVFGKTVVQFQYPLGAGKGAAAQPTAAVPTGTSGLGRFGDPSFNLGRYVKPYGYPLPWWPNRPGVAPAALPGAAPGAAQGPGAAVVPGSGALTVGKPSMRSRIMSRTAGAVM
jgi:hypothetical protein